MDWKRFEKKAGLKTWRRDLDVLGEVSMCPHSVSQLAEKYFTSKKKCSERMTKLFKAGLVERVPMPSLEMRGKPEFVYYIKKKGTKKTYGGVLHSLGVVDFELWLSSAVKKAEGVSGWLNHNDNLCRAVMNGLIIPDGWINLIKGSKKLLFFVEVDCGTESLTSSKGYAFGDKLDLYSEYFDSGEYNRDFKDVGVTFGGFRVLAVFRSQKRMTNFVKLAKEKGCDFVLCATFEMLEGKSLFDKCWTSIDGKAVDVVGK